MKKISFVIPVYRNEGSLWLTFNKVTEVFKRNDRSDELEFVFVNDGSDDNSINELLDIKSKNSNIKIISFSRNFGQQSAVIAGCREASGDAVVIMSADLQEPPELILEMTGHWERGIEIVIGNRIDRDDGFMSSLTSKFFYGLIKYSNPRMPEGGFDFVLLGRRPLDEFNKINEKNRFLQGDILWLGFSMICIPYKRLKRTIGKSQWTFSKKLKYFIDGLLNTSYTPIRMMSVLGGLTALVGFIYAIYIVYLRLIHLTPFTGWAPIMILILIIGGMTMLMLGVVGEYVWRIYDETRSRSIYIVKDKYL